MPAIQVYNLQKKKVGDVKVSDDFFSKKKRMALIQQVVNWQMAGCRSGSASVKTRSAVKGSTAKMYRQKGTGNARHGDGRAPIFVGGGRAFGPHPRDWSQKLPKKMRKQALRSLMGQKHEEKKLYIADAIEFKEIKTKKAVEIFNKLGIQNAMIVLDKPSDPVIKSLRNVPGFKVGLVNGLNVVDILAHEYLVMTQEALNRAQELLG